MSKKNEVNTVKLESSLSNSKTNINSKDITQIANQFIKFLKQLCDENKVNVFFILKIIF